jgi:ubiquinone biosynthesis accessory factor UbiJ
VSTLEGALGLLEQGLNAYLALDPTAATRLEPLHGRLIRLELRGLGLDLFLLPGPDGIHLFREHTGEPDCTLSGSPLDFAWMRRGERGSDALFKGSVEIRGDTEVGQRLGEVLSDLEVDWEEQLSRITGDVLAHQVGNGVHTAGRWAGQAAEALPQDLKEFLQEEARLLPTRVEAEGLSTEIERLRDDLARLEARVARIAGTGPGGGKGGGPP